MNSAPINTQIKCSLGTDGCIIGCLFWGCIFHVFHFFFLDRLKQRLTTLQEEEMKLRSLVASVVTQTASRVRMFMICGNTGANMFQSRYIEN